MKLQQYISKVEEMRATVGLYEELRGRVAQLAALESMSTLEELSDEQHTQLDATGRQLRHRLDAATQLLCDRVGVSDIDAAMDRIEEVQARVEQIHQLRREQVNLRVTLDLELALGQVPMEQRKQAEEALKIIQLRMDTALTRAEAVLATNRLITLVGV